MGHFHLTEMSPVYVGAPVLQRWQFAQKKVRTHVCVCVYVRVCAHMCVCVASVSYKMPSLEKLMW